MSYFGESETKFLREQFDRDTCKLITCSRTEWDNSRHVGYCGGVSCFL